MSSDQVHEVRVPGCRTDVIKSGCREQQVQLILRAANALLGLVLHCEDAVIAASRAALLSELTSAMMAISVARFGV
jgi:hypothetical protein